MNIIQRKINSVISGKVSIWFDNEIQLSGENHKGHLHFIPFKRVFKEMQMWEPKNNNHKNLKLEEKHVVATIESTCDDLNFYKGSDKTITCFH